MDVVLCRQMNCPAAMERIREDRPITIRDDKGNTSRCIAEIVSVSNLRSAASSHCCVILVITMLF